MQPTNRSPTSEESGAHGPASAPTWATQDEPARGALFTLVDDEGRFLLQHRTDDAPVLPGYWGFFGGGVEPGEGARETVVREAREELGITLGEVTYVASVRGLHLGQPRVFRLWAGALRWPVAQLARQQTEGQGLGMFTFTEAAQLRMVAHDRELLLALAEVIRARR
jgi:8-oxo-dGTP diphosphatase